MNRIAYTIENKKDDKKPLYDQTNKKVLISIDTKEVFLLSTYIVVIFFKISLYIASYLNEDIDTYLAVNAYCARSVFNLT